MSIRMIKTVGNPVDSSEHLAYLCIDLAIDLPQLDIPWEPEQSAKATVCMTILVQTGKILIAGESSQIVRSC
jgi:hypothetical protein